MLNKVHVQIVTLLTKNTNVLQWISHGLYDATGDTTGTKHPKFMSEPTVQYWQGN